MRLVGRKSRPRKGDNDHGDTYHGNVTSLAQTGADTAAAPIIRTIGLSDLHRALRLGWEDFKAVPSHAIILCVIYPVLGLVLARTVLGYSVLPLLFPLAAGFALLGPFAALGLYELSRRRERGEAAIGLGCARRAALAVVRRHARARHAAAGAVRDLGGYRAGDLCRSVRLCRPRPEIPDFAERVLTTPQGWWLIVVGCGVGFLFAVVALCISVVSFPLMLDRHAGAGEAMVTSLRAVARIPVPMAAWGLIVARAAGGGIAAGLPRPCRRHSPARPRHLASLSRGDRTGTQSAAASAPRRRASGARGGFPGHAVPVAAQGQRIGLHGTRSITPPAEAIRRCCRHGSRR